MQIDSFDRDHPDLIPKSIRLNIFNLKKASPVQTRVFIDSTRVTIDNSLAFVNQRYSKLIPRRDIIR